MNLAFIVLLLITCRSDIPRHARGTDTTGDRPAAAAHDTLTARDTIAGGPPPVPEDPPCFASHLGLPCR